ncbi:MAG: hypothetical protein BGO67_07875 [Alphaproteobacteria bacterium 41-28]|nr:MAG: hypothetical protein BGO67_07875 [Alphaproteobacteria bacterium 41-28]
MKKNILIAPVFFLGIGAIIMTVTPAFADLATCTDSMHQCMNALNSGTSTRDECRAACQACINECAGFNVGGGCRGAHQRCDR